MIDGGQHISSIDTHLQQGSELFDSDPKGALAAYYQAVSLDATHIEGWNQIGRLMFDLEQYSEAEMVFKRVENLANEQNLPDWAEMAAQNIDLAHQSISPQNASEPVGQNEAVQGDIAPDVASEEAKSIEDISNIASVAESSPNVEPVAEAPLPDMAIAEAAPVAGIQIPAVEVTPPVAPVAEIAPPEVYQSVAVEPVAVEPVHVEPVVAQPVMPAPPIPTLVPVEAAQVGAVGVPANPPEDMLVVPDQVASAQPSPMPPPGAPVPAMPYPEVPSVGIQPAVAHVQPLHSENGVAEMAPPVADQSATPPVQKLGDLQGLHQAPSANPFPAQPDPVQPAPAQPAPAQPAPAMSAPPGPPVPALPNGPEPDAVMSAVDAEMEAPKTSSGKIALMITGVVGAMGIGLGAAQYFNGTEGGKGSIPVIKSDAKLASKGVKTAQLPDVASKIPEPSEMATDQAYKVGMTHLVKGEYTQARTYLEQAESKGHAEAGYNLAALYAKGDGVEKNFEKAVGYLKKSAEGGYYPSMTNLGLLYANGDGVEQNYLTARSYWLKAAAGEHPDAMHNLAVIYATGKGVDKDMDEAIKWYRKAANAGYIDSIANLGLLYANGDGVQRDYDEAKRLWEVAAAKGHKSATDNLEKLKQVMAQ